MNSKEKAIELAWIELIGKENLKKLTINENGFSKSNCLLFISGEKEKTLLDSVLNIPKSMPKKYQPNGSDLIYRPKSLQGIETNNGWIKIESEKDLPECEELELYNIKEDKQYRGILFGNDGRIDFYATHYAHIKNKPKPIH